MLRRRTFLQGSGAVIALPFLESLLPRAARAAGSSTPPVRLISYFVPLGMLEMPLLQSDQNDMNNKGVNAATNKNNWTPTTTGANYALSPALQPLAAYKNAFTVISNADGTLNNQPSSLPKSGHAKGVQLYCAAAPLANYGSLGSGQSFDQVVAASIGSATRLPSLQLAINDESPYSDDPADPAYLQTSSWSSASTPMPALNSPTSAFKTLFPNGQVTGQNANRAVLLPAQRSASSSVQRSILDASIAQTASLQQRLGTADRQLLDQFLTNLRAVESSLPEQTSTTPSGTGGASTSTGSTGGTTVPGAGASAGSGASVTAACNVPGAPSSTDGSDFATRINQYTQLMPLAFACDQTRVISFMFARGESGRQYYNLGISDQHHSLSHYMEGNASDNMAKLKKIQAYEMQCFAQLLGGLQSISEGSGSMLDNTVILLSSELSDSMQHRNNNMPTLIAGGGGGRLKALGQHIAAPSGTTFAQVALTAIRATGVQAASFGSVGATASIPGML